MTTDPDSADLEIVDSGAPVSGEVAGSQPTGVPGSWASRVWFGAVVTVALALAFGPLPAYDYDRSGLNLHAVTPIRLWWAQAIGVHDGRWDVLATAGFLALVAGFLVLAAWALWYALQPAPEVAAPEVAAPGITSPMHGDPVPGARADQEPVVLTHRTS
ncbi:MAG: hypothetical protein H0U40_13840 [Chloroflexia bacterium]|nr:hypothetical protein [Chloroflexia bacterium]